MSRPSSTHRAYQSFQHDLNSLMQLSKSYSNFHKTIITALQKSQMTANQNFSTSKQSQIVLDCKTANLIVEISKSLIENDFLNSMVLKSLNISMKHLSQTLQLSCLLRQDINFIRSSVSSLDFFFSRSCEGLENIVEKLEKNLNDKYQRSVMKIKAGIEKCLNSVLPKSIFACKQDNFDEILVNFFKCGSSENLGQIGKINKIKEHSRTIQDHLIALTKKLSSLYWDFCINNKVHQKEDPLPQTEKKIKNVSKSLDKHIDKSFNIPEPKVKKIKAIKLLDLSEIVDTQIEAMSDGPVTETRINPGANKSDFGLELEKLQPELKKINKSYSNLKRKKSSIKSFPSNSSNSNIRTNRSSSKTKRLNT